MRRGLRVRALLIYLLNVQCSCCSGLLVPCRLLWRAAVMETWKKYMGQCSSWSV